MLLVVFGASEGSIDPGSSIDPDSAECYMLDNCIQLTPRLPVTLIMGTGFYSYIAQ